MIIKSTRDIKLWGGGGAEFKMGEYMGTLQLDNLKQLNQLPGSGSYTR